jgi:HrpA-like RNA helicase
MEWQFCNPFAEFSYHAIRYCTYQRSGRAGRTAPGKCFRLYSEKEYNEMNACSTPEILRVNLGQALLKLMELGFDPVSFDFVESPPKEQLVQAMETLE